MAAATSSKVTIAGPGTRESERILTAEALSFLGSLHATFGARRHELLQHRKIRWDALQAGTHTLTFATTGPALGEWRVAPAPPDLDDRRVEITGPAERK